jgi:hypothetical protein
MTLAMGLVLVLLGGGLFATTINKTKAWDPPLARHIHLMGDRQRIATARDKVRVLAYIALAFGVLQIVRATWFGA